MIHIHETPALSSDTLNGLIESITDALLFKDGAGHWIISNEAAKVLFNLDGVNWCGKTNQELAAERPEMAAQYQKCHEQDELTWLAGKQLIFENKIIDDAGNLHHHEVRKTPVFKKNGERKELIVICRDISDKQKAESNQRVSDTAMESLEAIIITDKNNQILRVNKSFSRLTGYSIEEVIGKTPAILKSGRHDAKFYQTMWNTLAKEKFWQGEVWDKRKCGEIYPKYLTITAVSGSDGVIHNFVANFTDISQHKEAESTIHRLAFYDPLTNLPNRQLLNDQLDKALFRSDSNRKYGALLMIDLDNFKLINDTRGHDFGDLLLMEVAKRLKDSCREMDSVARLGGDEFVLLLESLSLDEDQAASNTKMICEKLLESFNQPFLIAGQEIHSTLSIGIAMFRIPSHTSKEMLKHADNAMYQAKFAGKNTLRFFDHNLHSSLEKRMSLESELRHALHDSQFELYYQAQVDHSHKIIGAEVLLRWMHPQRGAIPPNDFIPLTEETGLILPIGDWVMRTACKQLKIWESNPLTVGLQLAVNVSTKQFNQPNFVELVCSVLEDTGARGAMLKLELTETLMVHNVPEIIAKMEALKLLGLRFSIDDFGTGYSSLSYLKKLPISQVKIDRSFVQDIDTNESDAIIAQTIIGMASTLGFNVIAEGVETENQRAILERYGCLNYQGFLFSKPVPVTAFEMLLTETINKRS
jgi:diguanylate cyclase (GGDEF)-like protein/PAS domain S-box-containing protein